MSDSLVDQTLDRTSRAQEFAAIRANLSATDPTATSDLDLGVLDQLEKQSSERTA
jgi:hypothetical protein